MKKNTFIYTLFLFLIAVASEAQQLRRKGSLGIDYAEASDSLLRAIRAHDSRGILVKTVKAKSTAASLGLQPGDILVAINDIDSLYLFDFQRVDKNLNEREPISVTFWRGRRKSRVIGEVLPAPKEFSYGEVFYEAAPYYRGYLRSIVHKPKGMGKFPAVFYLQDFNCSSIDMAADSAAPLKQLVDGWVNAGYAVYRIEKPGVGESSGTKDCARLNYAEELTAFENGFAALKKLPYIDSTKIFLFGHGVGGMTAPILAAKATHKPRGIIAYGTVAKPWFEYMIDTFRSQPALFNSSATASDISTRMLTPLLYDWIVKAQNANQLLENPDYEAIMTSTENPLQYQRGLFWGRLPAYFSNLNQQNILQAWASAALPTLAIHGEYDYQAISAANAQMIVDAVNEQRSNRAILKLLKDTNHDFVKVKSFEHILQLKKASSYLNYSRQNFNTELVNTTVSWMKQF